MRIDRAVIAFILAVTTFFVVGTGVQAVGSQTVAPVCTGESIRFVNHHTADTDTLALPSTLEPGRYTVSVTTADSYLGRSASPPEEQTSELVGIPELGYYPDPADDLEDGVESASLTVSFLADIVNPIDSVTVQHFPGIGPRDFDSVFVPAVCFVKQPPPETTTTTQPTTTTVQEPTTTQPPLVSTTIPEIVICVDEDGKVFELRAPAECPPPEEPECELECVPCPEGEMRTRWSYPDCEPILFCPEVPAPWGGYAVPMSPSGLLADCPDYLPEDDPVVTWYAYCIWVATNALTSSS